MGLAVGPGAARAGTSSARRWPRSCSGPSFEIHGGGLDLVFPHHENELAQSRALGHEFARIWMHNGMLRFTGEKMSKSVGNVETIREVLDRWGRETTLLFFLTAHWRSPIDFSDERMAEAQARADGLREVFRNPSEPAPADAVGALRGRPRRRLLDARGARADARVARPRPAPARARRVRARGARRAGGGAGRGARARARARRKRGRRRTSREADELRARDRGRRLGRCGTIRTATGSSRKRDARAGLRPPARARGAPRPARGARALGDRARARRRAVAAGAARASRSSPTAS